MDRKRDINKEPVRVLHVFGALNPGGIETLVLNIYRCIGRAKIQFDFALTQGVKSLFDDEVAEMDARLFYFDQKNDDAESIGNS